MRLPSTKTIAVGLDVDRGDALRIRKLLDGRLDPKTVEGTAEWVRRCFNQPSWHELVLDAIKHVLGGFSTEAIWSERSCVQPAAVYVNMGDTYAATVVYDLGRDLWQVTTWGDWLETAERRGLRFP